MDELILVREMANYIREHGVKALMELVLKAINQTQG